MRGRLFLALAIVIAVCSAPAAVAQCVTIQEGTLVNTEDPPAIIETGFDGWGYNYQARMFNGGYCDSYRDADWCQPWADVELIMKWNDAWISNQDCDEDGSLDRHFGYAGYIGSGAWLTNHQSGVYYPFMNKPNKQCRWTYFVKIVAVPSDAVSVGGVWHDGSGDEIGPVIWGSFAVVQEVSNDPCAGEHGLVYKGVRPGLGNWEDPDSPM